MEIRESLLWAESLVEGLRIFESSGQLMMVVGIFRFLIILKKGLNICLSIVHAHMYNSSWANTSFMLM